VPAGGDCSIDGHRRECGRQRGTLNFERKVLLYVSDKATVGPVQGATAVKYSGERPPN
jgi:hypothetical protein